MALDVAALLLASVALVFASATLVPSVGRRVGLCFRTVLSLSGVCARS
jgi:hypothetical protein